MDADLKVARANAKRAVTQEINSLRRCIVEDVKDGISDKIDKLKALFQTFVTACDDYVKSVEGEENLEACDVYFNDQQEKYIKILQQSKAYLRDIENEQKPDSKTGSNTDTVTHMSSELVNILNLPKVTLEMFNGDPLMYQQFVKSFEVNVEQMCTDPNHKLSRLLQYTDGPAKEAIRGCLLIGGERGYNQAKTILEKRFGNPHLVMDRVVSSLRRGNPAKHPTEVQNLADEVRNAEIILGELGMSYEINSQTCILDIVSRLQPYLQIRWKTQALEYKRINERYPDFSYFAKFMAVVASDVSDPVYGSFNVKKSTMSQRSQSQSNFASNNSGASNFQSNTSETSGQTGNTNYVRMEQPCLLCQERHRLWHCIKFKEMSPRQRLQLVKQNNLCHNCLLSTHSTTNCGKRSVCTVCGEKHTMYIHVDESVTAQSSNSGLAATSKAASLKKSYMPVVQVTVNGSMKVLALLDTGSTNSFCSKYLFNKLGISGRQCTYRLNTLNRSVSQNFEVVNLSVKSDFTGEILNMNDVSVIDKIPSNLAEIDHSLNHLKDLDLPLYSENQYVDIVIGQDHAEALLPLDVRKGKSNEPFAVKTLLGWTIHGYSPTMTSKLVVSHFVTLQNSVEHDVHKLWQMENGDLNECGLSIEDQSVLELWDSEYRKVDGHVELPIPWYDMEDKLPNNFPLAKSRLQSLVKRLNGQNLFDRYDLEINKLLEKDYAEIVPSDEIDSAERIWYLPHHAVFNDKKPDKLRVVYDCAAKYQGKSLNDRCKQGPNLNNNMTHVLLRFRENELALQADIEAMYNQVKIPSKDKDALRFLWYLNGQICHFRMTSHLFGGIWCASSSAYALKRTISECQIIDTHTKTEFEKSFYVDDYLHSPQSKEHAMLDIQQLPETLMSGGFNLTKFIVNDRNLLQSIPDEHRAKQIKNLYDIGGNIAGHVLGIMWHLNTDTFHFEVNVKQGETSVTRRIMLSMVSSIFDPLGLIGPVLLQGKLLFQEATRLKFSWDDPIPDNLADQWHLWITSLTTVENLHIPRCIKPKIYDDAYLELHTFADASQRAYGCCTFLRAINKTGSIHTQLIMSKNKVAPLKTCTVPRLELQAAVMAAKQDSMIRSQLGLSVGESYFWIDSEIVLKYIANETKRFLVFVSNRLSIIRQLTNPSQWHHISGSSNPADMLTRGKLPCELQKIWFTGPEFLKLYKETWNVKPVSPDITSDDREVKQDGHNVPVAHCLASHVVDIVTFDHPLDVIAKHYSSWYRMKRCLAWWHRLISVLKGQSFESNLTVREISDAEVVLIRHVQIQKYSSEIENLTQGKPLLKHSSVKSLDPFLDSNGLLKAGGRIHESESCQNCIIPANHPIAVAIAVDAHYQAHLGVEWTLSVIRKQYWLVKARPLIKRIIRSCVMCKKLYGKPGNQKMADLPDVRLDSFKPPFTNIGIDYCGPFYVRLRRAQVKRYACIFTCLVSRAVHIEKVDCLDTDGFINAFRRFVSRRGYPTVVYSDNGTNLVAGEKELRMALREFSVNQINAYAVNHGITWHFIPPHAPHMGGVWERMIGTIKRVLKGILPENTRLTDEILETVLCEVENIVNGRPLTKLSENVNDPTPLTPNHLLLLKQGPSLPPGIFGKNDMFRQRWRHIQHLANQFWIKWTRLYLPDLQKRVKWFTRERNLAVGDLVMISDENTPRNLWPLGLVESVKKGRDNLVRSVCIRTRSTSLTRPISKVILLEADV